MTTISATSATFSVPVSDIAAAERWYAALLGRCPDVRPTENVVEWHLFDKCWLQLFPGTSPAGSELPVLRFGVDHVDEAVALAERLGGTIGEQFEIPDVIKVADVTDPYGNQLSFYQELGRTTETG